MDIDRLLADRARQVDASGIRRIFNLAARLNDPINLSIGQPDFPAPEAVKRAAIEAIEGDHNGYTVTQGVAALRDRLTAHLGQDLGWDCAADDGPGLLVTSGTSGALTLAFMALIGPGDEVIIPDPYFVMYPHLATMFGGRAIRCDTYPDFQMTAERIEPLLTSRTKLVLFNSPSNPAGAVASSRQCAALLELCRRRGVLLISDEIYDEFTYPEAATERMVRPAHGLPAARCPSPARLPGAGEDVLLVRGFGKTYGVTGWRMGYCAGPRALIEQIAKFQQYTYVCAPSMAQWGAIAALDTDMGAEVARYQRKRDRVIEALSAVTEVAIPGGAFYCFPKVPERLGLTATQFVERCIERSVLVIPGSVFSDRDTHLRISYAASDATLARGLPIIAELMGG
jgi:aspartate/methionine/tyrosine aminotransferase